MTYEDPRFPGTETWPDAWRRAGSAGLDPLPDWSDDYPAAEPRGNRNGHGRSNRSGSGGPGRRGRSGGAIVNLLTGAVVGLLGGGVAIGVATLAAAFVRPQASPIIAVGEAAIDRTPPAVKNFAVEHFGTHDKTFLLLGIYTVIALIAVALGCLARRRLTLGLAGLALFGAFGAFVALTRPESKTTDALPSVIGGIAGLMILPWLVYAARPDFIEATGRRARALYESASGAVPSINRRRFFMVGAVSGVAAVAAGVGGQILSNRRFNVAASRNAVKLKAPVASKPVPKKVTDVKIPGLSPFYTPNSTFYRVDTALVVPQVPAQTWSLRIHGMVDKEINLSFSELMNRPMIERDITLCCVSETVGGKYIGNARWQGVRLADILREAGVRKGAEQIVSRDANGMSIGTPVAAVMDGRDAMLAVGMNGVPLPQEHGFPVRMVVPGLYGYVSACKWIVDMELTTWAAFDAYWVKRKWSQQAPIKTESRIDTPKKGSSLRAGKIPVAGVAWAQHKGIAAVEVSIDGGRWRKAKLAPQDTIDTWRQWYIVWDATPGTHHIQVRATDKTGYTQTKKVHRSEPNGATGWHTIKVTVT
jgi:DMSO/TMAO reductase YedYZ molybdopterin-dependent catalytic subunit